MWNLTKTVTATVLPCVIMQSMLGIRNTKYQLRNTWLLSAVYSQATAFPEQGFGC